MAHHGLGYTQPAGKAGHQPHRGKFTDTDSEAAHCQGNFNHNQGGFAKGWGIGNVGVCGGHWACRTSTDTRRGIAPGKSGPSYSNPSLAAETRKLPSHAVDPYQDAGDPLALKHIGESLMENAERLPKLKGWTTA